MHRFTRRVLTAGALAEGFLALETPWLRAQELGASVSSPARPSPAPAIDPTIDPAPSVDEAVTVQTGRRKVGLALGGGSARGFAHIGVLRGFEEHRNRIPVDYISGTSMGGLVR